MAELYKAKNVSEAWVWSMEYLLANDGDASNLIVEIQSDVESKKIREHFDGFIASRNSNRLAPIARVADTIFPIDFYRGEAGEQARKHLYRMERLAARVERRFVGDSYFDRLIDWPYLLGSKDGVQTWNQLEYRINRLQVAWQGGKRTMNVSELGFSSGLSDEENNDMHLCTGDMRTQHPSKDTTPVGFPCLSHISLTLFKGHIDLTATYRNQHFVTKAYGNYVGLVRLLNFICREVGCQRGAVICVATHADAELGKNKIPGAEIIKFVQECRAFLEVEGIGISRE